MVFNYACLAALSTSDYFMLDRDPVYTDEIEPEGRFSYNILTLALWVQSLPGNNVILDSFHI